jgi:hypothetical protein
MKLLNAYQPIIDNILGFHALAGYDTTSSFTKKL